MSSPDDSIEVQFSKGAADESFIIPNIRFEPIDDTERLAAGDSSAREMPKAQWESYLKRLKGQDITVDSIRTVTNLPEEDAEAIYKGMGARGLLEEEYRRTLRGRQLARVTLRSEGYIDQDNPPREWGVVIVDHPINGADFGEHYPQVFLPRPNPKAVRQSRQQQSPEGSLGPQSDEEKEFFDEQTLLDLDGAMNAEITQGIHRIKDDLGVDKLDPAVLPRIRAQIRRDVMRRFLGDKYSDDLSGRVETARLAAVKKYSTRDNGTRGNDRNRERREPRGSRS